jgi:Spy/CpxP family protein refolding chaperone
MKRVAMMAAAGLVLAVSAGCSQPYGRGSEMMMDDDGPGYRHGAYRMGPGTMQGDGSGPAGRHGDGMERSMRWDDSALNLTQEQRSRIAGIQKQARRKQWDLMEKMHEQGWRPGPRDGQFDEQAARKTYDDMAAMRKQMFENMLDERKRIDSVLNPQQREQFQKLQPMNHGWSGR